MQEDKKPGRVLYLCPAGPGEVAEPAAGRTGTGAGGPGRVRLANHNHELGPASVSNARHERTFLPGNDRTAGRARLALRLDRRAGHPGRPGAAVVGGDPE